VNGLIRQFIPKKMLFDSITRKEIAFAVLRLNHRPRQCLGLKKPHEVFMKRCMIPVIALLHFRLGSPGV
jgi:IS30 family transposase